MTQAPAIHYSGYDRKSNDFYATPAWVTEALLRHVTLRGSVWEPCCGTGAMSQILSAHGYNVVSSDITDHGFGTPGIDFFACRTMPNGCRSLVTNPPYGDTGLHRAQGAPRRRCSTSFVTECRWLRACRDSSRCWSASNGSLANARPH